MRWLHRTTEAAWRAIQAEGCLWGITNAGRYTYLAAPSCPPHDGYGKVLLEVEYEPKGPPHDNFGFNPPPGEECWQFAVFGPIPIAQIRALREEGVKDA